MQRSKVQGGGLSSEVQSRNMHKIMLQSGCMLSDLVSSIFRLAIDENTTTPFVSGHHYDLGRYLSRYCTSRGRA
jgi:hypothetical protein